MLNTVKITEQFEPIFRKAQEYVSKYFEEKKEDPSRGTIEIFGERDILVRAASMSVDFFETVKKLYEKGNKKEALNIAWQLLFDIAHAIGKQDAKNFHNKMICQMLGYSFEEISTLGVMDIYPEMARPHVTEEFERLTRDKTTPDFLK
jgi:PAS domain-containing protein